MMQVCCEIPLLLAETFFYDNKLFETNKSGKDRKCFIRNQRQKEIAFGVRHIASI